MLRAIVLLFVGVALGFGVAWVVFEKPFGHGSSSSAGGPSPIDIETAVARQAGKANATCSERLNPPNVWDCDAMNPGEARLPAVGCGPWVARVNGNRIEVEQTDQC